MGTTADKLNKILESKAAIKAAILAKGVTNVGDVLSEYPSKIEEISGGGFQIPTGTCFGYSEWESIPPEVITYINTTSGYDGGLFYNAIIKNINPETVFIPSNCSNMFDGCRRNQPGSPVSSYDKIILDCSRLEDQQLYRTFSNTSIKEIELRNTENIFRYYDSSFYQCNASKITGIDMKSCIESITNSKVFGNNWLYFIEIKNLGYNTEFTALNMSGAIRWGVENEEVPGSKQSLIDSLLTNSFDRATAGYPNCTITLSSYTKAALTEDEISQITAKGFTIV